MKQTTVIIDNEKYLLRVGFGVMMEFEQEHNKAISAIKTTKEIASLIYLTLKYNNEHFHYDFKRFVDDVMDENPSLINEIMDLIFVKSDEDVTKKKLSSGSQSALVK